MVMVKQGYQPVYRPAVVEFREIHELDGVGPVQSVYFEGQDGEAVMALYPMEQQTDGTWLVGGCQLVRSDERRI